MTYFYPEDGQTYLGLTPDENLEFVADLALDLPPDRLALFRELMAELDQLAVMRAEALAHHRAAWAAENSGAQSDLGS